MTDQRNDSPDDEAMLHDARRRAAKGGAGAPYEAETDGGAAGLGEGGRGPECEAAEDRADRGVPRAEPGESRSAIAPGSPEHHPAPHPAAGTGSSGPGTSVIDPDDSDVFEGGADDTVGGEASD